MFENYLPMKAVHAHIARAQVVPCNFRVFCWSVGVFVTTYQVMHMCNYVFHCHGHCGIGGVNILGSR